MNAPRESPQGVQFIVFIFLGMLLTFLFLPLVCWQAQGQDEPPTPPDSVIPGAHGPSFVPEGYERDNDPAFPAQYYAEDFLHPQAILAIVQQVTQGDSLKAVRYIAAQGEPMQNDPEATTPGGPHPDWVLVCYQKEEREWTLLDDPYRPVTSQVWVPFYVENNFTYPSEGWRDEQATQEGVRTCAELLEPR